MNRAPRRAFVRLSGLVGVAASLVGAAHSAALEKCTGESAAIWKQRHTTLPDQPDQSPMHEGVRNIDDDYAGTPQYEAAKAIGRLAITLGNDVGFCTAIVLSPKYLMTNYHCVAKDGKHTADKIELTLNYKRERTKGSKTFNVAPQLIAGNFDKERDYAILEIQENQNEDMKTHFGSIIRPVDLVSVAAAPRTHLELIGHPCGLQMVLSTNNACKRQSHHDPNDDWSFPHGCRTDAGSSGSGVFAQIGNRLALVGLHQRKPSPTAQYSGASNVLDIKDHSPIIQALVAEQLKVSLPIWRRPTSILKGATEIPAQLKISSMRQEVWRPSATTAQWPLLTSGRLPYPKQIGGLDPQWRPVALAGSEAVEPRRAASPATVVQNWKAWPTPKIRRMTLKGQGAWSPKLGTGNGAIWASVETLTYETLEENIWKASRRTFERRVDADGRYTLLSSKEAGAQTFAGVLPVSTTHSRTIYTLEGETPRTHAELTAQSAAAIESVDGPIAFDEELEAFLVYEPALLPTLAGESVRLFYALTCKQGKEHCVEPPWRTGYRQQSITLTLLRRAPPPDPNVATGDVEIFKVEYSSDPTGTTREWSLARRLGVWVGSWEKREDEAGVSEEHVAVTGIDDRPPLPAAPTALSDGRR